MFSQQIVNMFEKMAKRKGVEINNLIYKRQPVVSEIGNAALEMDILLTMQWLAYQYNEAIYTAVLLNHQGSVYAFENDKLNTAQKEAYRTYMEQHKLRGTSESKSELYLALAIRTLCFNGEDCMMTPVDYRSRIVKLDNDVLTLNFTAANYASLKNPNRTALRKDFAIVQDNELHGHQIEARVEHEQETPSI